MLTLGIRYLNGFSVASDVSSRESAEWPPHPGRIFMALAAAHFQSGCVPEERAALEWLESQEAPRMISPQAFPRNLVTQFVPVNDASISEKTKALLQCIPIARSRQPRTFAYMALDGEIVWLVWPCAEPTAAVREALVELCGKVTRIGHSSSLVAMWVAQDTALSDEGDRQDLWMPDNALAEAYLRVPSPGTMKGLDRAYNQEATEVYASLLVQEVDSSEKKVQKAAKEKLKQDFKSAPVRLRPSLASVHGYIRNPADTAEKEVTGSLLSPHFVSVVTFERAESPDRWLDLQSVLYICQVLHAALCERCGTLKAGDDTAALVTGFRDGAPVDTPHLAFVPMAFVGHPHADGRLRGMGIAIPKTATPAIRREIARVLAHMRDELPLGKLGKWKLGSIIGTSPQHNLRPATWTAHPKGATTWATVTPIVFDQHAKARDKAEYRREVEAMIRTACTRMGLPKPIAILLVPVSAHIGAPPSHAYPRMQRKDGSQRRHTHAILVFGAEVRGPVLLGAGRYRGYGLCRPLDDMPDFAEDGHPEKKR